MDVPLDIIKKMGIEQMDNSTCIRLKQEMASLREKTHSTIFMLEERIKEQISEIEELRHQVGNKKGDINIIFIIGYFYLHNLQCICC